MTEEERWLKVEEIVRRVVREEISSIGKKKEQIKLVNGRWEGITPDVKMAMVEAYPAVDVDAQLKEAAAWCVTHSNDAPRSKYGAFLNTWLKKHQDRHAIRSIPLQQKISTPPNLCEWCLKSAVGSVNGRRHCDAHQWDAMNGPPPKYMPGQAAKPVAGG